MSQNEPLQDEPTTLPASDEKMLTTARENFLNFQSAVARMHKAAEEFSSPAELVAQQMHQGSNKSEDLTNAYDVSGR